MKQIIQREHVRVTNQKGTNVIVFVRDGSVHLFCQIYNSVTRRFSSFEVELEETEALAEFLNEVSEL